MDALPPQVRAAAEEAERLQAELFPATPPQATPEPAVTEPKQEVPPVTAPTPEPPKPVQDEATWEHRYKTLQGMFTAQKQRDEQARKDLEAKLAEAAQRLTALEKPPQAEAPPSPAVTDKDVEEFGGSLIDLTKRIAQDAVQRAVGELKAVIGAKDAELAQLRAQLGGVVEQTRAVATQTYVGELTKLVPDWEAVNTSEEWLKWLAQPDPLSGQPRQAFLDDAFAKQDAPRTAAIFTAFKALAPAPAAPSPDLARQVQPPTSQAATASPSEAQTKLWSAGEIGQFYTDVARGAYRGRDAERVRTEAEIDAALATGRVRP